MSPENYSIPNREWSEMLDSVEDGNGDEEYPKSYYVEQIGGRTLHVTLVNSLSAPCVLYGALWDLLQNIRLCLFVEMH